MKKTEAISVRVPDEVKVAIEKAAKADDRTVTSMVTKILREYIQRRKVAR